MSAIGARDPEPIPRGTDYSSVIEADQPVVVQHTPGLAPGGAGAPRHDGLSGFVKE
jgi:hypothetical protein